MSTTQYSAIAKKLEQVKLATTSLMQRVREAAAYLTEKHGYSLECFATVTQLHRNTVMKLSNRSWEPTPDTLERLEELVIEASMLKQGRPGRVTPARRGRKPAENGKEAATRSARKTGLAAKAN